MTVTEDSGTAPKRGGKAPKAQEKSTGLLDVLIPPMDVKVMYLRLIGMTPLVVHKFSEKALGEMRDKQQGRAKQAREKKDPVAEFQGARYLQHFDGYEPDLIDAFPAFTIKKALISACRMVDGIPMTLVRQTIHVNKKDWLVPLEREPGKPYFGAEGTKFAPVLREDPVRVGGKGPGTGTADLRYRPEYAQWEMPIVVEFLGNVLKAEQVLNLFKCAGFGCGIGENRPEKTGGTWGTFDVQIDELAMKRHERAERAA